jgi:hypothetical protein
MYDKVVSLHKEVQTLMKDCERKLPLDEGRALWANFQNYAAYEDLKDLYKKCLPAVASCEDKIAEQRKEFE